MDTNNPGRAFRQSALKKVILGILGCLGMAGLYVAIAFAGFVPANPFMLIPAGIPFVYFCIGIIELLTGRPFQQLADAWMALQGWQRGVIGTLIVLVGGFLIFVVMAAVAIWLT